MSSLQVGVLCSFMLGFGVFSLSLLIDQSYLPSFVVCLKELFVCLISCVTLKFLLVETWYTFYPSNISSKSTGGSSRIGFCLRVNPQFMSDPKLLQTKSNSIQTLLNFVD